MSDDVTRSDDAAFVSRQAAALERWWNTVRWLRPRQLYGRVWFHAYHPRAPQRSAPRPRFTSGTWAPPVAPAAQLLGPERIELLSEARDISPPSIWNAADIPRLWLYHLHYFDDLNARAAPERAGWHAALIERWIAENPPGRGTGWEPYPASRRIVNWIKWAMGGGELSHAALQSLATQVRWLEKRLEWHLLGNHLLANAKAMAIAGCFFAGTEADRWRQRGAEILGTQLGEQVLADGGHFERSPMYHALVLEDVLDLLNAAQCWPERMPSELVERLRELAPALLRWLGCLCHPDGDIALFNDSALGVAPARDALAAYAARLGLPVAEPPRRVEQLAASGFARVERGPFVLHCDIGDIGPDYLPGHAHASSLCFELSAFGQRWLVNSGCSTYARGPERLRQRGTAAHNTEVVDGRDSSEVWSSFRVARRAHVRDAAVLEQDERVTVEASHDGYKRRPGVIHRRRFVAEAGGVEIEDRLEGTFERAVGYLHLHPEVDVQLESGMQAVLARSGERLRLRVTGAQLELAESTWHPSFNHSVPSRVLHLCFDGDVARARIELS